MNTIEEVTGSISEECKKDIVNEICIGYTKITISENADDYKNVMQLMADEIKKQ